MFKNNKMQYVIRTCSSENVQELQNLLNEMAMNGWELYSMNEVEAEDGYKFNCIFMSEAKNETGSDEGDVINISTFKSQMEKMLSPKLSPYESCVDIQSKIKLQQQKISKIKKELEGEPPASINRKKLNDKISAGLKELDDLKAELAKTTSPDVMFARLHEEKLTISLSEELLPYVDSENDSEEETLLAATVKTRLKLTDELGYVMPKIIFKDDEDLNPYEFCIKVRGFEVCRGVVYPEHTMFFAENIHFDKKPKNAIYDVDVVTGEKIVWLNGKETKDFWEQGLSGSEYIARVLEHAAVKYVDELIDYSDVEKYIDVVDGVNSFLVDNIIPDIISLADLRYILTSLIREKVSVKNIVYIFEKMNDFAVDAPKNELIKRIRLALGRQICKRYLNSDGVLQVFELGEKTMDEFIPDVEDEEDDIIRIDSEFAEKLTSKLLKKAKQFDVKSIKLVVPLEFRHLFFVLLSNYLSDITVLAREEIGCNYPIEVVAEI